MPVLPRVQHYRNEAKRVRALGRDAATPELTALYEEVARSYDFLAEDTEKLEAAASALGFFGNLQRAWTST